MECFRRNMYTRRMCMKEMFVQCLRIFKLNFRFWLDLLALVLNGMHCVCVSINILLDTDNTQDISRIPVFCTFCVSIITIMVRCCAIIWILYWAQYMVRVLQFYFLLYLWVIFSEFEFGRSCYIIAYAYVKYVTLHIDFISLEMIII